MAHGEIIYLLLHTQFNKITLFVVNFQNNLFFHSKFIAILCYMDLLVSTFQIISRRFPMFIYCIIISRTTKFIIMQCLIMLI